MHSLQEIRAAISEYRELSLYEMVDRLPMRAGITLSAFFHLFALLLVAGAVPGFSPSYDFDIAPPIPVQVVNISDVANLPNMRQRPKPAPRKPAPAKYAPPPPSRPSRVAPEPVPEVSLPEPRQVAKPQPEPAVKQETLEPPKQVELPKAPDNFASVLKTVEELESQSKPQPENFTSDPDRPLSITVIQAIQAQIERCWAIPAGARNAEDLVVEISMVLNPDGSVRSARIVNTSRAERDPFFRTAAESALRAVYNPNCNPLPVPLEDYEKWRNITLRFNPKEMLGL